MMHSATRMYCGIPSPILLPNQHQDQSVPADDAEDLRVGRPVETISDRLTLGAKGHLPSGYIVITL